MSHGRWFGALGTCALLASVGNTNANAQQIKTVFVIAMENHNWTQPANQFTGAIQQIFQNPSAPFINSLVDGSAYAVVNGSLVHISEQVAYATNYHNVLATPNGNNPHIHPSEPNYIWAEAGTNFGVLNDNDPFRANGPTNQNTDQHLTGLLHGGWKDVAVVSGRHRPHEKRRRAAHQRPAPAGSMDRSAHQLQRELRHWLRQRFQSGARNSTTPPSTIRWCSSPTPTAATTRLPRIRCRRNYAPLQQLFTDLANDDVAEYNWITPNQFNDMHTALAGGYKGLTGDPAKIKQGDDFLARSSRPSWPRTPTRTTARSSSGSMSPNRTPSATIPTTSITPSPRSSSLLALTRTSTAFPTPAPSTYTHSSDLRTMQEIFRVGPLLGDAANAKILGGGRIAEKRPDAEDFLHRAQIGGMRVVHGAGVGKAVDVLVSARRDDDLADGVIEVVGIVADGVLFGLIEPDDDRAVVLVGVRGHDGRDDLREEIVALLDLRRVAGESLVAAREAVCMSLNWLGVIQLYSATSSLARSSEQLLQRRVLRRQRIRGSRVVAAVGVGEEHHRIVLGGVVELRRQLKSLTKPAAKLPLKLLSGTVH